MPKQEFNTTIKKLQRYVYRRGINYSLDTIKNTLGKLDQPETQLPPIIHIAGTNGKGSTLTFIKNALMHLGYSVGTYTSPHLYSYTERICIDKQAILEEEFCKYFEKIESIAADENLTEFEILTMMMILYFKDKNPDYLLIETGLGGRLDATNILPASLSVITKIGLDHMELLGNSLAAIAAEKAGIIKQGIPVITIEQDKDVLDVIEKTATAHNSPLHIVQPLSNLPKTEFPLGIYQKDNLALASGVIQVLFPEEDQDTLLSEMARTPPSNRFSIEKTDSHIIIKDAAHNPHAIRALLDSISTYYPDEDPVIIMGILKRKNAKEMLETARRVTSQLYYCPFDQDAAFNEEEVREIIPDITVLSLKSVQKLNTFDSKLIVFTGSIHFLSNISTSAQ